MSLTAQLSSPTTLRRVLAFDAVSGAGTGVLHLWLAPVLASWLGLPEALLQASGVAIFAFVLLAGWLALQASPPRGPLTVIVLLNVAWALGCVWLAFGGAVRSHGAGRGVPRWCRRSRSWCWPSWNGWACAHWPARIGSRWRLDVARPQKRRPEGRLFHVRRPGAISACRSLPRQRGDRAAGRPRVRRCGCCPCSRQPWSPAGFHPCQRPRSSSCPGDRWSRGSS